MTSTWMTTAIAIVGTLLGSALTAFVTDRIERRKNEALERQQIRQEAAQDRAALREMRVEHQKWRRDRRQAAYKSLMDAAHEAQGAIWQLARLTLEPYDQHRYDTWRGAAIDAVRATRQAATTVELEGPAAVAQAGAECERSAISPTSEASWSRNWPGPWSRVPKGNLTTMEAWNTPDQVV
ncbi:hypothetical protein [Streptomyces sp. NPDC026092]|uniref:hypothetical protein n=1 Tax=Streptomyces sp. NPDC026092 TaxID=3154797 RepID=UPI0033E9F60B